MPRTRIWDADNGQWLDVGGTVGEVAAVSAGEYGVLLNEYSVPNNTFTTLSFSQTAREDNPKWSWNAGRDTLTVTEDGWYDIHAGFETNSTASGNAYTCLIRINTVLRAGQTADLTGNPRMQVSLLTYLTAGQTVDVRVRQVTGAAQDIDNQATFLSIRKVQA